MKNKFSKPEAEEHIKSFFIHIKKESPKEIKKIKRFAMRYNIPLKGLRKKFCKKCLNSYKNSKIRIKNKIKNITCDNCGYVSKWKTS